MGLPCIGPPSSGAEPDGCAAPPCESGAWDGGRDGGRGLGDGSAGPAATRGGMDSEPISLARRALHPSAQATRQRCSRGAALALAACRAADVRRMPAMPSLSQVSSCPRAASAAMSVMSSSVATTLRITSSCSRSASWAASLWRSASSGSFRASWPRLSLSERAFRLSKVSYSSCFSTFAMCRSGAMRPSSGPSNEAASSWATARWHASHPCNDPRSCCKNGWSKAAAYCKVESSIRLNAPIALSNAMKASLYCITTETASSTCDLNFFILSFNARNVALVSVADCENIA